jgi:hypothetical protein
MNPFERRLQVSDQAREILAGSRRACDENIVSAGACDERRNFDKCCAKPPANSIADDSVADLFGDGKTETGSARRLGASGLRGGFLSCRTGSDGLLTWFAFKNEGSRRCATATADTLKLRSFLERLKRPMFTL